MDTKQMGYLWYVIMAESKEITHGHVHSVLAIVLVDVAAIGVSIGSMWHSRYHRHHHATRDLHLMHETE